MAYASAAGYGAHWFLRAQRKNQEVAMAKHKVGQSSADQKFCAVDLRDDYQDGDPLPPPKATKWFDTEDEAKRELDRRIDESGE